MNSMRKSIGTLALLFALGAASIFAAQNTNGNMNGNTNGNGNTNMNHNSRGNQHPGTPRRVRRGRNPSPGTPRGPINSNTNTNGNGNTNSGRH